MLRLSNRFVLLLASVATLLFPDHIPAAAPHIAGSRKPNASSARRELLLVRERYRSWLLDDASTDYSKPLVRRQFQAAIHNARRASRIAEGIASDRPMPLYDTRQSGRDRKELYSLVTEVLPFLSVAYHVRGPKDGENSFYHDHRTLELLMRAFDRLDERGFRSGMQMPWKSKDARRTDPATAIIVDFHLRTAGYAIATLLMREELQKAGKLQRTLATCQAVCTHGEKTGGLDKLKLNADGVRIAVNFVLPYILAAEDTKRLMLLKRQLDRSMAIESDASDTIKPDGLGFHHLGIYLAGYAPYAVSQTARAAWLLRDTSFALAPATTANLRSSLLTLRVVSQKYDMHKALAGRLKSISVIPNVLLGYAYLAALEKEAPVMHAALARLGDDAFLDSNLNSKPFHGARNEAPPGPGAVDFLMRTLADSNRFGPEPEPNGFWALNYGPLAVHRRDAWMVSIKGFSKYLWAFERSLTDALNEERRQNVLGLHDSSFAIRIYNRGQPINAFDSGYASDGWDWCHQPGATVRQIPAEELLRRSEELGRQFNRPFGSSPFAGGVSLAGRNGLFAMQYSEVCCDTRQRPLQANKSAFFFDDQIVLLTSDIRNGDGQFPVVTTLYQAHLAGPETPTWTHGRTSVGLEQNERFQADTPLTLADPAGNGYYIPRAANVVVTRRRQQSLDDTGTHTTTGPFAAAWFDHGKMPQGAGCEFVILVDTTPDRLTEFAEHASEYYQVLQCDTNAHVVTQRKLRLTGYAIFRAGAMLQHGVVAQTDAPCLIMTEGEGSPTLRISVCNPDLGWQPGKQYLFRHRERDIAEPATAPPMPVRVKLHGAWQLASPHTEVSVQRDSKSTILHVGCSDARSVEFELRRRRQPPGADRRTRKPDS